MSDYKKMNPADHRALFRFLCREDYLHDALFEVVILEWSAQGRPKLKYQGGAAMWVDLDDLPEVVEILNDTTKLQVRAK